MFNLYINERRIEDVTVLDLKGRIRITGSTRGLHNSIRSLVEEGKIRILLNLSKVTHIDSNGLDQLVASCVTARNQGGDYIGPEMELAFLEVQGFWSVVLLLRERVVWGG